jgi:hypothetical protein
MSPASGATSADLLARVCAELDARMAQLRPVLDEYSELLDAAEELDREAAAAPRRRGPRGSAAGERAASGSRKPAASSASKRAASGTRKRAASGTRKRAAAGPGGRKAGAPAPRGAAEQAIVAALEHGSHTVGELVLVTAMSGSEIRAGAQQLQRAGAITRTKREGRAAYALAGAAAD